MFIGCLCQEQMYCGIYMIFLFLCNYGYRVESIQMLIGDVKDSNLITF